MTELPISASAEPSANGTVTTSTEHTVTGEVLRVVYRSDDGRYVIIRILDPNNQEQVLVGSLDGVHEGEHVKATGRWERHKEYGTQFRVNQFQPVLPHTRDGMCRYLGSGILPGIGPKLAERIVDKFGGETFTILDKYSSRLSEVAGLGRGRVKGIKEAWERYSGQLDTYTYLQGLGVTPAYCARIVRHYGDDTVALVGDNPFRLASEVKGIGFKMADSIARHLNIAADNPFRLGAGVTYVLEQLSSAGGHTCFPQDLLTERAESTLSVDGDAVAKGIERASVDGAVVVSAEGCQAGKAFIYLTPLHRAETELAVRLTQFAPTPSLPELQPDCETHSRQWQSLNAEQRQATIAAFANPLSIITGGPGVGKTTVTREIVGIARALTMSVELAAPTGRAAKRLSESSRCSARTIHRLLKWEPQGGGFVHGPHNPISADLIIIDEVSMLDLVLANNLFRAIADGTRVVLVGDRDQLPSVGPGSVLRDLIAADVFPVTELRRVYRQASGSDIIMNAHRVNSGRMPARPAGGDTLHDFYWIEQDDPTKVNDLLRRLVMERIPERFGLSPIRDIQVLTPMNRGDCGVHKLNNLLQDMINSTGATGPRIRQGESEFRVGDRVMQRTNNYDLNVYNGDIGYIEAIDADAETLTVGFDAHAVTYPMSDIDQLQLAYAVTIHKSQGSEFPAVIVPVLTQHTVMLRRNLIYTAMTRARQLLVMVGTTKAMSMAVNNFRIIPRYSYLAHRLRELAVDGRDASATSS